jgi:hypothetical protein
MKNHEDTCAVVTEGECTCSFTNQPGRDIIKVLNGKADLYAEIGDLNAIISAQRGIIIDRDEEIRALLDYPWGRAWTYALAASVSGVLAIVTSTVFTWMLQ